MFVSQRAQRREQWQKRQRGQRKFAYARSMLPAVERILTVARHVLVGYILLQWSVAISYAIGNWSLLALTCIIMVAVVTRERLRHSSTP